MQRFQFLCSVALLSALTLPAYGQRLKSPEVNEDRSVTFRVTAPDAEEVTVSIARVEDGKVELEAGERGVWEGTSKPLPAGIHEYSIQVDGTRMIDPRNRFIKKWYSLDSLVEVPGSPALVTERQDVPHGSLHLHYYASIATDSDRPVVVYTPPSYDQAKDQDFPVLFLLHGFGDDQAAWTEVGRAHFIADNLIAQRKMVPMIIVMPYGHPAPLPYGQRSPDYGPHNDRAMEVDVLSSLSPFIEKKYRVKTSAADRGIVGLSMGGGHSLWIGLRNPAKFGWVGAFSAAAPSEIDSRDLFPKLQDPDRKLLWIACGDRDFLLERNHSFIETLEKRSVEHEYLETKGAHNWSVWRDEYLPQFLPLLFRE